MSRIILKDAILSYPNLFTPYASPNDEAAKPKFSGAFVFPDPGALDDFKRLALTTAQEKWGEKLKGGKLKVLDTQHGPANFLVAGSLRLRMPWQDNAEVISGKGYPEGSAVINARSLSAPGIVSIFPGPDGKPLPVTEPSKVYPGVIVNVSMDLYAYDTKGNRGVAAGLGNVQIVRDGERLDHRINPEDEFNADESAQADLGGMDEEDAFASDPDDLSDLLG